MSTLQENVLQPQLPKIPGVYSCFSGKVEDAWFGMRFLNEENLQEIANAENFYREHSLSHTQELSQQFFVEAKKKISAHPEIEYPTRVGGSSKKLFTKTDTHQQHPQYFLTPPHCDPKEILNNNLEGCTQILDVNVLAEERGENGYSVGEVDVYKDTLVYTECTDGSEKYQIIIKNMDTEKEIFGPTGYSEEVAIIGNKIIAIKLDEAMRPYMVVALPLETLEEEIIFCEENKEKWISFDVSVDEDWLTIYSSTHDSTVAYLYRVTITLIDETIFSFTYKTDETDGTHHSIDAHGNDIIVLYDQNDGQSFVMDIRNNMIVPPRENHQIVDAEIILFSHDTQPTIVCTVRSSGEMWVECWMAGACTRLRDPKNLNMSVEYLDHVDDSFIVSADSWVQPDILYSVDSKDFRVTLLHEWLIPDYNVEEYDWRIENITVRDEVQVPVSLVWNKKYANQQLPALVYAYGAYGSSLDAWWSASRTSLLDRGIMFVVVHARGGGENGRVWHNAGRRENKRNTMNDVYDCVAALKENNIVSKVVLRGRSAGGAMVAATANLSPNHLFDGFVSEVPFVDALATMSDETLPLTVGEYGEWGNPQEEYGYHNIAEWDPMQNMSSEEYARFFVVCGVNDPRVGFWEALKFVGKLRERNSNNTVFVRLEEGSGHFGTSGRFDSLEQEAEILAFVYDCLTENSTD
jgi:oligopeptidase B